MTYTATGLTGHGKAALGASVGLLEVDVQITTLGTNTRVQGNGSTPRIYQAGWIGTGYENYPTGFDEVDWETFLMHPSQAFRIYPLQRYSDTFYWDLDDGVVIDVQVYW